MKQKSKGVILSMRRVNEYIIENTEGSEAIALKLSKYISGC